MADVAMQEVEAASGAAPAPAAASAPAQNKDKDKERRDKEKAHHEQKRKRVEGANGAEKDSRDKEKGKEKEKAEPEFACRVKYRNTLPELPFDPKLRALPLDPMRHVRYRVTSLENFYRFPVLTEPDLGIPIDLLDPDTYRLPPNKPSLAPEDAALLTQPSSGKSETPRVSVQWLRKHQYITHDYSLEKLYTRGRQNAGAAAAAAAAATTAKRQREEQEMSLEAQMEAIERGFEAAKQPPRHGTNPKLAAVEVLSIVPDLSLWGSRFTHVIFDTSPIPNPPHPTDPEFQSKVQHGEYLIGRSVLKGYVESSTKEKFSVLYVPKRSAEEVKEAALFGDENDEAQEEAAELEWVRKYNYKIDGAVKDCFVFIPQPEKGTLAYVPIDTKVTLTKSSVPAKEKPEKVTFVRKAPTEEVLQSRQLHVTQLTAGASAEENDAAGNA